MKASKPNALDELKAKIGQAMKPVPEPRHPKDDTEPVKEAAPASPKPSRTPRAATVRPDMSPTQGPSSGRGVHFYVDDSDRKILNSLAVWFASQDRRMSDSQVIKASIRLAAAQQNARLLELADQVRAGDRRRVLKPGRKHAKS
jgi:hypothetical protein